MCYLPKQPLAVLMTILGLVVTPIAAFAQSGDNAPSQNQPPAMPPAQEQSAEIDSDTLDNFVTAYQEVQKIQQDYVERMQDTETEATELQQQAEKEMQQAVIDSGLSITEYQQIASKAGQDPALRSRIEQKLNSGSGKG